MSMGSRAARELRFLRGLASTALRTRGVAPNAVTLACDDLEAAVDKYAARTAIVFEGRRVSYAELDAMANRYASWAKGRGIIRGQTVALFMPNRIEFLAVWYGLSKVGVATALVDSQLTGVTLAQCLNACNAAHLISDAETTAAIQAVRGQLTRPVIEWVVGGAGPQGDRDLDQALRGASALRPTRATARDDLTAKDVAVYMFISDAASPPRAAKITHMRIQLLMRSFAAATKARPSDRIYNPLPLHQGIGGLCAVGAALLNGATMVLTRRFSADRFWADVAEHDCTMSAYVGALWRDLVDQPQQAQERDHGLRLVFGHGLQPDVWAQLAPRFHIAKVLESYGAVEGNVLVLNFDGELGAVGRAPAYLRNRMNLRLVRRDTAGQAPERGPSGLLVQSAPGEVGEAVGRIGADARSSFAGYTDKAATAAKIVRDAFQPGDAWFRTGDLVRQDEAGYLYRVYRVDEASGRPPAIERSRSGRNREVGGRGMRQPS